MRRAIVARILCVCLLTIAVNAFAQFEEEEQSRLDALLPIFTNGEISSTFTGLKMGTAFGPKTLGGFEDPLTACEFEDPLTAKGFEDPLTAIKFEDPLTARGFAEAGMVKFFKSTDGNSTFQRASDLGRHSVHTKGGQIAMVDLTIPSKGIIFYRDKGIIIHRSKGIILHNEADIVKHIMSTMGKPSQQMGNCLVYDDKNTRFVIAVDASAGIVMRMIDKNVVGLVAPR